MPPHFFQGCRLIDSILMNIKKRIFKGLFALQVSPWKLLTAVENEKDQNPWNGNFIILFLLLLLHRFLCIFYLL
jgi:hypothetical protein